MINPVDSVGNSAGQIDVGSIRMDNPPSQATGATHENELLTALRDILGNDRTYSDFAIRHTKYGVREKILHCISFGVAYSDARKAYKLEKGLEKAFAGSVCELQRRLSELRPDTAGSFDVSIGDTRIHIEQDASGRLTAKIGTDETIDTVVAFELPFTASTLSNKIVNDMLSRPEVYPKKALLHSLEADLRSISNPLRREVYETILQKNVGLIPDEVSRLSNMTIRRMAIDVLNGAIKSRQVAMQRVERELANAASLQKLCRINDEQAASLTANLEQAMAADAARVDRSVDISALIAPTAPNLSPEEARIAERNTRIHDFFADLILTRDASVHDKNIESRGEALRETLIRHASTIDEILSGDAAILDTLGPRISDNLGDAMETLRDIWDLSSVVADDRTAAAVEILRQMPLENLAQVEDQIDELVVDVCAELKTTIADAVADMRRAAPPQPVYHPSMEEVRAASTPRETLSKLIDCLGREIFLIATNEDAYNAVFTNTEMGHAMSWFIALLTPIVGKEIPKPSNERELLSALKEKFGIDPVDDVRFGIANSDIYARFQGHESVQILFDAIRAFRPAPLDAMMEESFDPGSGYGRLITDVMEHYFDAEGVDDPRAIDYRGMVASYIRYTRYGEGNDPTPGAELGAIFKGAGPILQKALQGLDVSNVSPELAEAVKDMKSSLAPIDPKYVQAQLLDIVERSRGEIKKITITRSLGAASVGQAFLCTVEMSDPRVQPRSCVLKLLRPDVRNKAMREKAIFERYAANIPGMTATFAGQLERILDELDLTAEARNAEIGKIYEDVDVDPPRVCSMSINDAAPPSPGSVLLERAPGSDLASVMKKTDALISTVASEVANNKGSVSTERLNELMQQLDDLEEVHARLATLSKRWVEEGIFGGGFYHGDLHAGNIMIDMPDRATNAAGSVGPLTVIDYGNATSLTSDQRSNVLVVMAGATFSKPHWFLEGYLKLLDENGKQEFLAKDVVRRDALGYLMDAEGERILNSEGNPISVDDNGYIAGTHKKAPGALTAMINRIMAMGSTSDTAKRISVALTLLQQHGVNCPGAIFNFSACQIRLQNAADGVRDQIRKLKACIKQAAFDRLNPSNRQPAGSSPFAENRPPAEGSPEYARLTELSEMDVNNLPDSFVWLVGDVLLSHRATFVSNLGFFRSMEIRNMV